MTMAEPWAQPRPLQEIGSADLSREGVVFRVGSYLYRTSGAALGYGGMGTVVSLERRRADGGAVHQAVGKIFHPEYLLQLRTDELTRRDYDAVLLNIDAIADLDHPNLLPTYVSAQISDNHLTVSPRMAETLRQAVARGALGRRRRVELLLQALDGLEAMHRAGYLHRDVTLRNILVDRELQRATLFDFDLSLSLEEVRGLDYKTRYVGRVFGSPGYSVPPEILDTALMESPIHETLDVYAVGSALFGLFSNRLPYGDAGDMWGLLLRISDGVVRDGTSYIDYPDTVPHPLRRILEGCLERDPGRRTQSVAEVSAALREVLDELDDVPVPTPITQTLRYGDFQSRLRSVTDARRDRTVTEVMIATADQILERYGYQIYRALGRVKEHPIFLAAPAPELVAKGAFPDLNIYPKIVTIVNLAGVDDREKVVETWLSRYVPILRDARQGLLTSLYRATYDERSKLLLLFTEYVDDARFGSDLDRHELTLEEAFGLGYLVAQQVARLHERGLAHNNVGARSLLLKGLRDRRVVHPAMVGIVSPSLSEVDMAADVRRLAALVLSWVRADRIGGAGPHARDRIEHTRSRLDAIAHSEGPADDAPTMVHLLELIADGLSAVDFNFGVLRENLGDLDAYALLLVSHSLYGRLWS